MKVHLYKVYVSKRATKPPRSYRENSVLQIVAVDIDDALQKARSIGASESDFKIWNITHSGAVGYITDTARRALEE